MSGYERPTEKGQSKTKVSFYAVLTRRVEDKLVPYAQRSPSFTIEAEMIGWIRHNRQPGDEVAAWRRTSRVDAHDFHDDRLFADDEHSPDPERLHALIVDLKNMLKEKQPKVKNKHIGIRPSMPIPTSGFDPMVRMLSYDEVYGAPGSPPKEL